MAITFPSLTSLPQADVTAARALLIQRLQEKSPTADFRRGVLHDLLLHLESIIHAGQETYADKFRKAGSISAIESDPTLADDALVDAVLSNFLITRKQGSKSSGEIIISVSNNTPVIVGQGSVFTSFGKTFTAMATYAAKSNASSVISPTDRLIYSLGDGTYGFNISVEASVTGEETALKQGDRLEMQSPVPGFIYAAANIDFTAGTSTETNLELINRLKEGVASQNFSNKYSLVSLIKNNYVGVHDVACISYGDPEQIRYHGLFPLAHGGRVDAYIRNTGLPSKINVNFSATLIEQRIDGGLWQISIARDTAPGFYEATRIVRFADKDNLSIVNGYETIKTIRSYDLSDNGSGFLPEIENSNEAAFSSFQTATLQFLDTDTDASLTLGSKGNYSITLRYQKNIAALQLFLSGKDVRPSGSDILVKAAIPFDVRISITIDNRNKEYTVPSDTIREEVYKYVSNLGFSSVLYESNIIAMVQNVLTNDQSIEAIDLRGRLVYPNGAIKFVNGRTKLSVPEDTSNMVSTKTAVYFLDKADIEINVRSV
jgi:hypothetical protein